MKIPERLLHGPWNELSKFRGGVLFEETSSEVVVSGVDGAVITLMVQLYTCVCV